MSCSQKLYPLLFEPAYKQVFWGGKKIQNVLKRDLPDDILPIGESWEICDRPNISSEVLYGPLAGTLLRDLVEQYGQALVGRNYHSGPFPLMVKLISTAQPLSIQVHPTEEFCGKHTTYCEPKSEMWYILDAERDSTVSVGLKPTSTRQIFLSSIRESDLKDQLQEFSSVPGDAYFIPAGKVHTLSGGNLVLEISGNSDTAFRLTDWNRNDETGEKRELHIHDAVSCMDFIDRTPARICGASNSTNHNRKYPLVNRCPYFHCDALMLVANWRDTTGNGTSCHILTAVNQAFEIHSGNFEPVHVGFGESVLIPACLGEYLIVVSPGSQTDIIRTTL